MGRHRITSDSLSDLKKNAQQFAGETVSIRDRRNKLDEVLVVEVKELIDPFSEVRTSARRCCRCSHDVVSPITRMQNGEEDVYYRVIDSADNLIKAIKVRDATVEFKRDRVRKYNRIVRIFLTIGSPFSNRATVRRKFCVSER